jgi:hypothetical protein
LKTLTRYHHPAAQLKKPQNPDSAYTYDDYGNKCWLFDFHFNTKGK